MSVEQIVTCIGIYAGITGRSRNDIIRLAEAPGELDLGPIVHAGRLHLYSFAQCDCILDRARASESH